MSQDLDAQLKPVFGGFERGSNSLNSDSELICRVKILGVINITQMIATINQTLCQHSVLFYSAILLADISAKTTCYNPSSTELKSLGAESRFLSDGLSLHNRTVFLATAFESSGSYYVFNH